MDVMSAIYKFAKELEEGVGTDDGRKLFFLKSLIFLYRLIGERGFRVDSPIAVIVNNRRKEELIAEELRAFLPATVITTNMTETLVNATFAKHNSDVVVARYIKTRRSEECISRLTEICENGFITDEDGKTIPFNDPVFVVFEGGIPLELCENFAGKIQFNGSTTRGLRNEPADEEVVKEIIKLIKENWSLIRFKLENMTDSPECKKVSEEAIGIEVFWGTEVILETLLALKSISSVEKNYFLDGIKKAREQIQREWIIDDGTGGWDTLFRELLFEAAKRVKKIVNVKNINDDLSEQIDEILLYDNRNYYLPPTLFSEICLPMSSQIGERQIKKILANAGYIKKEGKTRDYYSLHVPLLTRSKKVLNPRKVIISREKVDVPGQLSWKEAICAYGGGCDDNCENRA